MPWITDPATKLPSVSLTSFVVAFIILIGVSVLQMLGKVENVGAFQELLYTTAALYFGRRLNINNKSFGSDPVQTNTPEVK